MKRRSLAIILLIIIASLPIPEAVYAGNPALVQTAVSSGCPNHTFCSAAFTNPVAAGDLVVVETTAQCETTCVTNALKFTSVTDITGAPYTQDAVVTVAWNNALHEGGLIGVYHYNPPGSTTQVVTVTLTGSPDIAYGIRLYEYSNTPKATAINTETAQCLTSCSGTMNAANTINYNDTQPGAAIFVSLDETKTVIADSPFSGPTFCPSNGNTWDLQCYALFSPAGSTNYPAHFGGSPGNNGWQLIGTFYKPGIVYLVIPCTWFQQQCWWYPSLFFGLYLGLFAVVARKAEIEGNALTYLMLSALNMSAIAQTAMGLLTPVIPLLLITLTVVYVVRFRKR